MKYFQIVLVALVVVLLGSCVSAKKYREAERQATAAQQNYDECKVETDLLKKRAKQLEGEIQQLQADKASLEQDTTLYGMKNRTLLNQLAILENDLRLLAARLGNTPEYKALMEHLMQMQDELLDSEDKRLDTQRAIEEQKRALEASQLALADSKEMLQNSQQALQGKEAELLLYPLAQRFAHQRMIKKIKVIEHHISHLFQRVDLIADMSELIRLCGLLFMTEY